MPAKAWKSTLRKVVIRDPTRHFRIKLVSFGSVNSGFDQVTEVTCDAAGEKPGGRLLTWAVKTADSERPDWMTFCAKASD